MAAIPRYAAPSMRLRVAMFAFASALVLVALHVPTAIAGPVILGGDDLPYHGCYTGGANQQGWLYIQKAMARMFQLGCITRPNDGTVVALGVSDPGSTPPTGLCGNGADGGSAIHFAAGVALGKTILYYNGPTGAGSVSQFFVDLANNTIRPAVIWIPSGLGDLPNELDLNELNVINSNAAALAAFVNQGGGLMSHTTVEDFNNYPATYNQWLPAVIPGLSEQGNCNSAGATLTPAGVAAFPGLSNSDIDSNAGPCHSHFVGPIGSLQVLALDGDSPPQMYILGGDCSTQFSGDTCSSPVDTCCAIAPTFANVEHPALSSNLMVGTREAFGSNPNCVTVFDLASVPPSPLEDKNWATILRYFGPGNSWNVDSLGSVFGLTIDSFGNIFVTHTSCYNFDYIGQVFGAAPGAVYRIDALTGKITTFCVLPNLPDAGVSPGSNFPGLGNISFDCRHNQFFVTNLEDGRIYRIKAVGTNGPTGSVVQSFDPLAPDNGTPGWAPLGERLWGVQWHADRVYYGVWSEDFGAPSAALRNEVRSVALFPGGGFNPSSDRHELWMPPLPAQNYSNPVSDISFDAAGDMLLAERGITGATFSAAHVARALEYVCSNNFWVASPNIFMVGMPGDGQLCAGGVDYDRRPYTGGVYGRTWASADIMHAFGSYPDFLSGYEGQRPTGGTHLTSLLVDSDGNASLTDKTFIGDVEVVGCPGPVGSVCGRKWLDQNLDGVHQAAEPYLSGWTMTLSGTGGTFTAITGANGQFCFTNVPPGTYTLSETLQPGWLQTAPAAGTYPVVLAGGQAITGLDFGNYSCSAASGPCATAPPGMVAWWPFDDPLASPTAKDVVHPSPPRNVATLYNGAAITAVGHVVRKLCVPGELDYAVVPNANQMGLSFGAQPFSIDVWVNANAGGGAPRVIAEKRVLLSTAPYRTLGWALYLNGLQSYLEIGNGVSTQILPGPTLAAASWQHLAVTVERSPAQGRWYLNGAPASGFNFVPTPGSVSCNADLYIGRSSPSFPFTAFAGCIDDLEIFASVLSPTSVATLYAAGAAGKCPDVVRLPETTTICASQTSVNVCFTICNTTTATRSYHWALAGLPAGPGCTVAGPVTFTPATGTVTLAPGACSASICTTIPRPAGLTAQNATSCYQLTVVNDSTGACQQRTGTIRADNTCWCVIPGATTPVFVPGRLAAGMIGVPIDWGFHNPCNPTQIPYRVFPLYEPGDHPDPLAVSLNGLPPGTPVEGTLTPDPGGDATLEVLVSTPNGYDPGALYTIVLEADTDGDGVMERIGGQAIQSTYADEGTVGGGPPAIETPLRLRAAPNPFTHGSTISFALVKRTEVALDIFDASGRLVRRLKRGTVEAGPQQFEWDGRDGRGRDASVGLYFVRLRAGALELETRLVRLR